ncbi:S10 family peptidase [Methylocella silvestris]|uniref:Peptidase S10 n=1 Tax=Methylocella silvestris TaxID=199596 RepID=A0A2J7TK10_METSI|nr:peptidase S10 [Methylocella silvestris]PNG27109.1 peptidase S10 [Methylocella silvestris]
MIRTVLAALRQAAAFAIVFMSASLILNAAALFTAPFLAHAAAEEAAPAPNAEAEPAPAAASKPAAAAPTTPPHPLPPPATTLQSVALPGRALRFKAVASAIRLSEAQSGEAQADVATVAYSLEGQDSAKRPVAFVVNGGPGAASAWLNLGALGPWRLDLGKEPVSPSAPAALVGNAETWLDFADLVFIDPPLTGYSRILAKGDGARRQFLSVDGDIEALAVVMRKWLTSNQRLESPKFIVGESYGGFRAPKLARRLQENEGVGIKGIILISPVIDFSWFEAANSPLPVMTQLPSLAAAGRGLKPADAKALDEVEAFASGPYLTDLLRSERDPAALTRIVDGVARLTGLEPAFVRRLGGRVDPSSFAREAGRAEAKIFSRYDMTIAGFDPSPHAADTNFSDPVLDATKTPFASAMANLTATKLGWPVDARYEILNESVSRQWNWDGGRGKNQSLSDLSQALAIDPEFRVLIVHGLTDLVTPYFASKLLIGQIPPFGDPGRVALKIYEGGHMPWLRDGARAALRDDARKLIEGK